MLSPSEKAANPVDRARIRALFVGGVLGCVAWALSAAPGAGDYQLAMALIVILAGSASFVAHALHERGASVRQAAAAMRVWICALGSGVCLSILGMQWLAG
jgi:hypothetical protein